MRDAQSRAGVCWDIWVDENDGSDSTVPIYESVSRVDDLPVVIASGIAEWVDPGLL